MQIVVKEEGTGTAFTHIKEMAKAQQEPEQPLPVPFELPFNYPFIVKEGIKNEMLSGLALSKFIACIASSMFKYKSHPTKYEYDHVGKQIVEKFPFLKCSKGREYVSMYYEYQMYSYITPGVLGCGT